ncbi:septum formation initiator family protein [Candidatus Dependentiae bacterium]
MRIKVFVRYIILVIFSVVCIKSIVFGDQGLNKYFNIKNEIEIESGKILRLEKKIIVLSRQINNWLKDDFELEKMAREELQMGYANEKVYLLKN